MANPEVISIIKLGGSLMDIPDLRERLLNLVATATATNQETSSVRVVEPEDAVLIIPGGGAAADEIRRLDQLAALKPEQAHQAAIDAMSLNAVLLARLFSDPFVVVKSREEAHSAWGEMKIPILCTATFLTTEESRLSARSQGELSTAARLPASWDITSDSIAAWIARRWPSERLILAKSVDLPHADISRWAEYAAVDPAFETLARGLKVQWKNLRTHDSRCE